MLSFFIKLVVTGLLLLCFGVTVTSYSNVLNQRRIPRFEDYRIPGIHRNAGAVIAVPRLFPEESSAAFNRRVRQAAKNGPNFAGHYAIVGWSCGFICTSFEIVDVRTGRIYGAPVAGIGDGPCPAGFYAAEIGLLEFRRDSRLLILRGVPELSPDDASGDASCATRYYVWRRNRLVLIRTTLAN